MIGNVLLAKSPSENNFCFWFRYTLTFAGLLADRLATHISIKASIAPDFDHLRSQRVYDMNHPRQQGLITAQGELPTC